MSTENDNRHLASGNYPLPSISDAREQGSLDWQGRGIKEMMGGQDFLTDVPALARTFAPFRAIEVGPGTGLRVAVLAEQVPDDIKSTSKIYGVDIARVPALYQQPSNVEFVQADIIDIPHLNDPRFKPNTFHFITHRLLVSGLNFKQYAQVCFDLLAPGGRVEFSDPQLRWFDANDNEISQGYKWLRVFRRTVQKLSLDSLAPERLPQWLREIGFVDVETKSYRWLMSEKNEEDIAKYSMHVLTKTRFPAMIRTYMSMAGMDSQVDELEGLGSVDGVLEDFRKTVTGVPKGTHKKFLVTTARKP